MKINVSIFRYLLAGALLTIAPLVRAQDASTVALANLKAEMDSVESELKRGKLDKIHHHAEAINAAAQELAKDTTLAEAKKARVEGYVKNILKLTDAMHDAADSKNLEATRKEEKKLKAQVDLLAKQFAKPGQAKSGKPEPASESK
jgi:hypothetical protein